MAQSLSKVLKAMAEIEVTYGTAPSFVPGSDGFIVFQDGSPVQTDTTTVDTQELTGSFTKSKELIGRQLYTSNPKILVQGSGTAGTVPLFNDLLRCCALSEGVAAGSSVVYTPRSSGFESTSLAYDFDGLKYLMTGVYGSFSMSGSAGQPVEMNFDLKGLYTAPSISSPSFSGHATGSNIVQTMKSSALTIDVASTVWATGSAEPLLFKSFSFDRGVTVGERADANSSDGLFGLNVEDSAPTLEIVVEGKTTVGASDIPDFWADLTASTTHNVNFVQGTTAGNIWTFAFPTVQLTNIQVADGDGGIRTWTLSYRVQHVTADSEFSITLT